MLKRSLHVYWRETLSPKGRTSLLREGRNATLARRKSTPNEPIVDAPCYLWPMGVKHPCYFVVLHIRIAVRSEEKRGHWRPWHLLQFPNELAKFNISTRSFPLLLPRVAAQKAPTHLMPPFHLSMRLSSQNEKGHYL